MARDLEMQSGRHGGVDVLHLAGEVDLEVSSQLRRTLLERIDGKRDLLIDLNGVSYIDSSGVASLIEAFQRARKDGLRFALARVPEGAMRVLKIAQLDRVFPILPDIDIGFGEA